MNGNIFDIKKFALHDGPGIRTTLFMSGCPLNCLWCHNPECRYLSGERGTKTRNVSSGSVADELAKDIVFYEESGGGVTFSGGEPLMQPDFLKELLEEMKRRSIHSAVDTTGYAEGSIIREIIPLTGLFLYDLKIMDPESHKAFTGVDNTLILENLRMILKEGAGVRIRFPLIPGYNDQRENITEMIRFLKDAGGVSAVDVLPYHRMGVSKYRKLSIEPSPEFLSPPSDDKIRETVQWLNDNGFAAEAGG